MKALVAVELQLRSDPLFLTLHGQANGVQNQIDCLLCCSFVSYDAVVVEVPDHRQVQYALIGVDIRDVRYPFVLGQSAWNTLLSRFLYWYTCCPICCHFLRRRISDSRSYFFMTCSTVLGLQKIFWCFSHSHIRRYP